MPSTRKQPRARGRTGKQPRARSPKGSSGSKGGTMTRSLKSPKGY